MKKSKIDTYELIARIDYMGSLEENMVKQANLLESSYVKLENVDKQFFEMGLEIDATIESLANLTIYNLRSANAINSLAFPAASYIWNNIRYVDDNDKSFAPYCHFI